MYVLSKQLYACINHYTSDPFKVKRYTCIEITTFYNHKTRVVVLKAHVQSKCKWTRKTTVSRFTNTIHPVIQ